MLFRSEVWNGVSAFDLRKAAKLFDFLLPLGGFAVLKIFNFGFVVLCSARLSFPVHSVPEQIAFDQVLVRQRLLPTVNKAFERKKKSALSPRIIFCS